MVRRAYFGSLIQKWFHLAQTVVVMGFFQKEKRARSAPSLPGAFTPLWSEHLSGGVLYLGPIWRKRWEYLFSYIYSGGSLESESPCRLDTGPGEAVLTVAASFKESAFNEALEGQTAGRPARGTLTRVTDPFKVASETRHPVCRLRFKRPQSLM